MMIKLIILLSMVLVNLSNTQIIKPPIYSFERLTWGSNIKQTQESLGNKQLIDAQTSDNPYFKKSSDNVYMMYIDTVFSESIGVQLVFTKLDSTLQSIVLTYLGIDPNTKMQHSEIDKHLEHLMEQFITHYGEPQTEKKVPLVGKVSQWSFPGTNIQALKMTGFAKMLSITFSHLSNNSNP